MQGKEEAAPLGAAAVTRELWVKDPGGKHLEAGHGGAL